MKLDTYAAIWEILPFYGTLDQVFRLMRRLNNKTSEIWKNNMEIISKNVRRKKVNFTFSLNNNTWDTLSHNPFLHSLYQLGILIVNSEKKYEMISNLLDNIPNPFMIKARFALSLSPERDTDLRMNNFEDYAKN